MTARLTRSFAAVLLLVGGIAHSLLSELGAIVTVGIVLVQLRSGPGRLAVQNAVPERRPHRRHP